MAVSAFKSSSRRSTQNPSSASSCARDTDKKPPPPRRSRSVSSYPRRGHQQLPEVVSPEFLIKRDNPLFWIGDGSVRDEVFGDGPALKEKVLGLVDDVRMINGGFRGDGVGSGGRKGKGVVLGAGDGRRGRSVSRDVVVGSVPVGSRKGLGRSLSRVDTGKRSRSVSQNPVPRGYSVTSESEIDQDSHSVAGSNRGVLNSNMGARAANSLRILNATENLHPWMGQRPVTELHYDSATSLACSRDDGTSTGSLSGVEEKTIRAVSEQMKSVREDDFLADTTNGNIYETVQSEVRRAITDMKNNLAVCRSNRTTIVGSNLADISPNLVNSGAVELVRDIRSEYAKKLEESQERARKLRADLAVEEYHVQELSRLLKEILPEPRTSLQNNRPARKASIERRRIYKLLTEEAMAYFDECVSLSTFDSSDFSSTEDPLVQLAGDTNPISEPSMDERLRHHNEYSRATDCSAETHPCCLRSHNSDPSPGNRLPLSGKYPDLQQDIKKLLKHSPDSDNSAKGDKGILGSSQKGHNLVEEYSYLAISERSLSERVAKKKWLEHGLAYLNTECQNSKEYDDDAFK
ncbi:hypothetical protein MLD38_008569 [Melastoma candidum]|uniref:Uncharacterized protein n=1 Tax=Melastoma candidum TaxID=119954 RepID=A0ACB9RUQ3_9MYRT|nr:hypothetical protein MLD38_008569 [Melastoma candidum]